MSLKWNENVTLVFLNAYQKHPCLWNPYYVKYYNCLAKNNALKNIIKELNIPELNISDCLEQIKVIRKKYGQEQTRVIKGFQSGKSYESPFAWFSIITEMLTKMIDDESKLQNRIGSMKMISPVKDCITTAYDNNSRYKIVSNFPCMQDYKPKSRKNSKFTKSGNFDILEHESEGQSNAELLQCPSCGWEDINPNKSDIKTVKKAYEKIKSLNITVPKYSNLANKLYKAHRITDNMHQEKYENIIPCPTFSSELPSYTGYSADMSKTNYMYYPQSTCNYINQQTIPIVASKPKFCTRKTQLSSEQLFPERQTKQVGTIVKQRNKGIQNIVCVSKAKTNIVQKCCREIQSKPLTSQEVSKQVAVNTVEQCDKKIQNTICASPKAEKVYFALDNKKLVENEVCTKETCSSLLSHNIIEIIKHNSAVTQALLQCLEKIMQEKTNIYSVMSHLSKIDVNSNSNSEVTVCEQIPCKLLNENIHSDTNSAAELESLSCLPCLEKTEKDNTIAMFTETFLELMKHVFVMSNKNIQKDCVRKEDAIDTFIVLSKIKECADEILKIYTLVDWSKRQILNKFYCRSKSKSTCPSKKNSALNSIQTQDTKEDVVDQFTSSYANSKDVEVLYEPSTSKIRDYSLSENDTAYAETTMDEPFVKDKDVTARTENHDMGLNISLPQILFRDSETQYTLKQLQDTGIVTDPSFEEKISVATQNREPILIRVIKSNNSGGVLKLDKETCVRDAHVLWNVDKYSKNMYQKYSVRKYYDELLHPGISHVREKEVNCIDYRTSLLHTVPNLSNRIYRYYKGCRSSLPCNHDWIKANITNLGISSTQRVSRIPLYARSHKYTQRRTDLYRMSRSYI